MPCLPLLQEEILSLYRKVKEIVTTRAAAKAYGIHVNRSGMACCPFHDDREPSMKVDRRFHCFGCGADGDVIDFTAMLFGLSRYHAARKLAEDFGVKIGDSRRGRKARRGKERRVVKRKQEQSQLVERFEQGAQRFFRTMTDYYHLLGDWKEKYAPKDPEEEWDPRFCEALSKRTNLAYVLDCFLEGNLEEQVDIMNEYKEEVLAYDRVLTGLAERKDRNIEGDTGGAQRAG